MGDMNVAAGPQDTHTCFGPYEHMYSPAEKQVCGAVFAVTGVSRPSRPSRQCGCSVNYSTRLVKLHWHVLLPFSHTQRLVCVTCCIGWQYHCSKTGECMQDSVCMNQNLPISAVVLVVHA